MMHTCWGAWLFLKVLVYIRALWSILSTIGAYCTWGFSPCVHCNQCCVYILAESGELYCLLKCMFMLANIVLASDVPKACLFSVQILGEMGKFSSKGWCLDHPVHFHCMFDVRSTQAEEQMMDGRVSNLMGTSWTHIEGV